MEVKAIASDPDEANIILADRFTDLENIAGKLVSDTCDSMYFNYYIKQSKRTILQSALNNLTAITNYYASIMY